MGGLGEVSSGAFFNAENAEDTQRSLPGMPDTGITLSSSMEQRMATGHTAVLAPVANSDLPTPLAGAGALRSSANDMLTFLEAFLAYRESPLGPAMRAMLEVRRPAGQATIGLGWLIMSDHGREIVWHNGATAGFRSFAGYNPEERVGVVVLSNATSSVDDIGLHLLNLEWRRWPIPSLQSSTPRF